MRNMEEILYMSSTRSVSGIETEKNFDELVLGTIIRIDLRSDLEELP